MTSPVAEAREAFVGVRIQLVTGKVFETRKVLLFPDALRWADLLERFDRGEPMSVTIVPILQELETQLEAVDMSVLDELTLGEVLNVLYRFFSQRRTPAQLASQQPASPTLMPPG